jgi:hypothetical protein
LETQGLFSSEGANKARKVLSPEELATFKDKVAWSKEEDDILLAGHQSYGPNWQLVLYLLSSQPRVSGRLRSLRHCQQRWHLLQQQRSSDPGVRRRAEETAYQQQQLELQGGLSGESQYERHQQQQRQLALQQESDARSRKKGRRKVEVGSGYVGRLDSAGCLVPGGFGGEHTWRVLEKGMKAVVSKQQVTTTLMTANPMTAILMNAALMTNTPLTSTLPTDRRAVPLWASTPPRSPKQNPARWFRPCIRATSRQ